MNLGMTLGLMVGVGLVLCGLGLYPTAPPLWVQIAPYVPGKVDSRMSWQRAVARTINNLFMQRPQSIWGNDSQIAQLLGQAAREQSLRAFRQQQIRFAGLAIVGAGTWILLRMTSRGGISPMFGVVLLAAAPVIGGWYAKWSLASSASKRVNRIEHQLPTVLDLLAFALAAGQAILPALKKISQMCCGDLADELDQVVAAVATGVTLSEALEAVQVRVNSDVLTRSLRSLTVALERGTPLAMVLRAQADDARAQSQRYLVELASKKETAMMLPIVFFILPMIVVVALYPGLVALQMM